MPSKQIVVGLAGASLILVAGCGAGSTSTAIAAIPTSVPVSAHSPVASGPVPARHIQRYMNQYARIQANKHMNWHVHVHRHVDIGVPHTDVSPHFDTPQAAMRYAAAAWNAHDIADLRHVTDPSARAGLHNMRSEATRLALGHCQKESAGDYYCTFSHEYPNANIQRLEETDGDGIGHAYFLAAPADGPGWYMTGFQGCGG